MQGSKNNGKELTRRQEQALLALMDGASLSLSEVARKMSINYSTLWRWLNRDEVFMRRYRDMRRASVEMSLSRIQGLMGKAVDALERGLSSGNKPSEARCAATIINKAIEAVEVADFDERLKAIERRFEK